MNRVAGRVSHLWAPIALACCVAAAPGAFADDPPTRVGRIAFLEGTVSFHPSPDSDWGTAVENYPVAAQTAVWTDDGGRAEIEIGAARIRLDADTELDIRQLDDQTIQLSLPQGRVDVTLHGARPDEHYDIETPRGDVALSDGTFRIFAGTEDDPTRVAAFAGIAEIELGDQQTEVTTGREAVAGPAAPPTYALADAAPDSFDDWSAQRDGTVYGRAAPAALPPVPGSDTLASYGSWRTVPDYGPVWTPADVPAGWAPYTVGRWSWVAPWGWTWIDAEPWGFAPFHYGRWVAIGGVWSWVPVEPGAVVTPGFVPVYSPALVSFLGQPSALVLGFDGAVVGWVPLGPGEFWQPWFPVGFEYVRRVNVINVSRTTIANLTTTNYRTVGTGQALANAQAARIVPAASFAAGRPVQTAALSVNRAALAAPLRTGAPGSAAPTLPPPDRSAHLSPVPVHAAAASALRSANPAPSSASAYRAAHPNAPAGHLGTQAAPRTGAAPLPRAPRPGAAPAPRAPYPPGPPQGRGYAPPAAPSRPGGEPHAAPQTHGGNREHGR
jgi:hypothetical protein